MEELLKQTENTDFLSVFESARTSIIKELDKIKLQYQIDKIASKNSQRTEYNDEFVCYGRHRFQRQYSAHVPVFRTIEK